MARKSFICSFVLSLCSHSKPRFDTRLLQRLRFLRIHILLITLLLRRQRPDLLYRCKLDATWCVFAVQIYSGAYCYVFASYGHESG